MTISGVAASSVYSPYHTGAQPSVRQQMSMLFRDVQAGNLSAARSDFSALSQLLGISGGGSGSGPFSALLGQVGSALSSGDITAAQSALSDYQTQGLTQAAAQAQAANAATPQHRHHHHTIGGANADALASLIQSIQGGDLGGAQQAFASLTGGEEDGVTSAGASTSTGAAHAAPATANGTDMFSQLIASLGASLANNDITAAQQELTKFAQNQKVGSVVNVAA